MAAVDAAPSTELKRPAASAFAGAPRLEVRDGGVVRLELQTSEPLEHDSFVLADPDRLVVDFPEIAWRMTSMEAAALKAPGVRGVRFGLFRVGRSRMVIDLDGAPRVLRRASAPGAPGDLARFVLDFTVESAGVDATPYGLDGAPLTTQPRPATVTFSATPAPLLAPRPANRPRAITIALDPGHGGIDPGASYNGVSEKTLTLSFARELKAALEASGSYRVVLTRDRDEFVALGERVARARAMGANLFLSIHADALPQRPDVSGASVYTLSDQASDDLAAELARRENAADAIAGVAMPRQDDTIREVLVDLAKQRTLVESDHVAALLVDELRQRVPVLKSRPHRYAGFRVLKTFDTPGALIELGFLTNLRDRRRLTNPAWREQAAAAIAAAVGRWTAQSRLVAELRR